MIVYSNTVPVALTEETRRNISVIYGSEHYKHSHSHTQLQMLKKS